MAVDSADEFYSIMGVVSREMLEFGLMDCNELVNTICSMAPFPFPQLQELREKYTFDIRPFAHGTSFATPRKTSIREFVGLRLFYTDDDEEPELDADQLALASAAWYSNQKYNKANVSLDIGTLKRQYAKLRDRQRQAHVILTSTLKTAIEQQGQPAQQSTTKVTRPSVNNLLAGQKPIVRKVRPISKVQFTMPEEPQREGNRPRGPRAMRTKVMIDERQRGETLTWEQINKEKHAGLRTRSWSSSSDSSSTSLADPESGSPSPFPPASPRFSTESMTFESQEENKSTAEKHTETTLQDKPSNLENKWKPQSRKLIIADHGSLSEENSSPAIAAAPQMWHQIPDGPFVEDESDDCKKRPHTPPTIDQLLERYTKVTHLVEDASARLVASTSIDSGDSRTPPSRADSPPLPVFNPFPPTHRQSAFDNQVARKLGLYSTDLDRSSKPV